MSMNTELTWRQFEELVARIESILAPKGAVIKSPDRIVDKVTGRLREVDASIKIKVGSVDVLMTMECRKRNDKQDDTWIEQLVTKKEKIGAAYTIAISSEGFSNSAKKTASQKGIFLRTFSDISDDEIGKEWLRKISVSALVTDFFPISYRIAYENQSEVNADAVNEELQASAAAHGIHSVIAYTIEGHSITLEDIASRGMASEVFEDGKEFQRVLTSDFQPGKVYVKAGEKRFFIKKLSLTVSYKMRKVHSEGLKLLQYTDENGSIMEIVRSHHQVDEDGVYITDAYFNLGSSIEKPTRK